MYKSFSIYSFFASANHEGQKLAVDGCITTETINSKENAQKVREKIKGYFQDRYLESGVHVPLEKIVIESFCYVGDCDD